jgi:anti-sigma regulatory factor (Ser/Thr protein kinase)
MAGSRSAGGFRHEAILYRGREGFLRSLVPWVMAGVAAGEPVLVATDASTIDAMRSSLDVHRGDVRFVDIREVGRNPARIIPVWRAFVDQVGGDRPIRGIGEPIWPGRSPEELVECHLHESLLNVAFPEDPDFWLVCPYDRWELASSVIDEMGRTHPALHDGRATTSTEAYAAAEAARSTWRDALPQPTEPIDGLSFGMGSLQAIRRFVADRARRARLMPVRADDLVLAVNELATNSLCHGGGGGTVRVWEDQGALIAEVSDRGHFDRPMAGREAPSFDDATGRGLWLVNQLCDLVQMRSTPMTGTVVRVRVRIG